MTKLANFLRIFIIFTSISALFLISSVEAKNADDLANFNRDLENYNAKLRILENFRPIKESEVAKFRIAIADNEEKRQYGLMHLENLPQTHAMLFIFDREEEIAMWMKNTKIPLDMLFIDSSNSIVNIKTNAKPMSLDLIFSGKKVNKVLEINAGLVKKFKINIGQRILISQ